MFVVLRNCDLCFVIRWAPTFDFTNPNLCDGYFLGFDARQPNAHRFMSEAEADSAIKKLKEIYGPTDYTLIKVQ